MREYLRFYIDGRWVDPIEPKTMAVENPATEQICGTIALGSTGDVDRAVSAAGRAFPAWSRSSRQDRLALLQNLQAEYQKRAGDLAAAVTEEMGAPATLAASNHVPLVLAHLATAIEALKTFSFEEQRGATLIAKEPIGVCGLITPWNWPLNQIAVKVVPALATGCTMVLKPSEIAPFSARIFAEVMHAAGVPAGVFNLVQGDGPEVGAALCRHPEVAMISFTGSTRAGIEIARNAASTVKRVSQELGGKNPRLLLDDDGFADAVGRGVVAMMLNSGQTCAAGSRMLVPISRMNEAMTIAREVASGLTVGDPTGDVQIGPVASGAQYDKVQRLIRVGIDEGATLVTGGTGRPQHLHRGYFVKPTVFAHVTNDMTIAREEIFGPVLSILGYSSIDEAIEIANDTEYGLSAYVHSRNLEQARAIARRIRAGQVSINDAYDLSAPFGGFKQSGNGREWGEYGFHEFLEYKAIPGYTPAG